MTQQEQIEKRLANMPSIYRGHYRKAMRGRSMKAAIKAQCLECVNWARKEVELCTDSGCPLFLFRPFQAIKWKARRVKKGAGFQQTADAGVVSGRRIEKTPVGGI
jgi:hypothetical protein